MRGNVHKRGLTWSFTHDAERTPDGRRRQVHRGGFRSKREAQQALAESLTEQARGAPTATPSQLTLREYLEQQ